MFKMIEPLMPLNLESESRMINCILQEYIKKNNNTNPYNKTNHKSLSCDVYEMV